MSQTLKLSNFSSNWTKNLSVENFCRQFINMKRFKSVMFFFQKIDSYTQKVCFRLTFPSNKTVLPICGGFQFSWNEKTLFFYFLFFFNRFPFNKPSGFLPRISIKSVIYFFKNYSKFILSSIR